MGGWNSGRSGGRPTADSCLQIDLAALLRNGRIREGDYVTGSLRWTCRGEPSGSVSYACNMFDPHRATLRLNYTRGPDEQREQVEQTIALRFTTPHYGGRRWWMICPYQHMRVSKLYLPPNGDRFASRQAWRLGYRIQRVPHHERPLERLFKLQAKLGCELGYGNWPSRPKGMWHRTYARELKRFNRAEHELGAVWGSYMERSMKRVIGNA